MYDDIVQLPFRQIQTGVDAESEVIQLSLAERPSPFLIYTLSEEGLGIAQLHGNPGKPATKHQVVKLLKLLLYVWDSCRHLRNAQNKQSTKVLKNIHNSKSNCTFGCA